MNGSSSATVGRPAVAGHALVFTYEDVDHALTRLTLDCDDAVTGRRTFRRTARGWSLSIPRPDLNRLEYGLVVTDRGGHPRVDCDPSNPDRVRTAFGERSEALLPGYRRPTWLDQGVAAGSTTTLTFPDNSGGGLSDLPITVWSPDGVASDMPARLLVVHDGPEYLDLAALGQYAAAVIATGQVPAFRMACLHPVERDRWYSANHEYVRTELSALNELVTTVPTVDRWVVLGASLGGLTSLLLGLAAPDQVAGVLSQSGSFFTPRLDEQESSYPYFGRVVEAVAALSTASQTSRPLHVSMTCGQLEENFANNDALATDLDRQGHQVTFVPVRDLHNYTAWRDALEPTLTGLLRAVWSTSWLKP